MSSSPVEHLMSCNSCTLLPTAILHAETSICRRSSRENLAALAELAKHFNYNRGLNQLLELEMGQPVHMKPGYPAVCNKWPCESTLLTLEVANTNKTGSSFEPFRKGPERPQCHGTEHTSNIKTRSRTDSSYPITNFIENWTTLAQKEPDTAQMQQTRMQILKNNEIFPDSELNKNFLKTVKVEYFVQTNRTSSCSHGRNVNIKKDANC